MSLHDTTAQHPANHQAAHMPIGFVIDAQGREVPITEDMIQQACNALEMSRQQTALQS